MYSGSGLCQATTGSKRSSTRRVRVHGVLGDAMPELAQALDRGDSLARVEVVEHRLRHQEVGRRRAGVVLELGHPHGGIEREIDVVAQDHRALRRSAVEVREPVAARLRRLDDLPVVREVERAAHDSTSTVSSRAAASARSSAATLVSAVAIT